MALLALLTAAAHAALPDALKPHYTKKDDGPFAGSYFLDVTRVEAKAEDGTEAAFAMEDVKSLKGALQRERAAKEELDRKVKAIGDLDPVKAREALAKLKELGDNPSNDEKVRQAQEALKTQLETKHGAEVDGFKQQITSYEQQMSEILVDQNALTALSKLKLVEGGAKLIMPHIKSRIKVIKGQDGKLVAKVIDPKTGRPAISMKQGNNDDMDIDELVESISKDKDFKFVFQGSGASGSAGAGGSKGKKAPTKQRARDDDDGGTPADDNPGSTKHGIHRKFNDPTSNLIAARERAAGQTQQQ